MLVPWNLGGPGSNAKANGPGRNVSLLTAQWWQWVLGIPAPQNPLLDETGEFAGEDQPYKGNKVFFLVGVFNESGQAERSITVPQGTSFFFPLLNVVFIEEGTVPEMRAAAADLIDNAVDFVYVSVDGVDMTAFSKRVASTPFAVRLPDDNVVDVPSGTYAPAVSDGYWFYLPPLSKGTHTLEFGGSAWAGGSCSTSPTT